MMLSFSNSYTNSSPKHQSLGFALFGKNTTPLVSSLINKEGVLSGEEAWLIWGPSTKDLLRLLF